MVYLMFVRARLVTSVQVPHVLRLHLHRQQGAFVQAPYDLARRCIRSRELLYMYLTFSLAQCMELHDIPYARHWTLRTLHAPCDPHVLYFMPYIRK